jgi:hypothetical protein
MDSIFSKYTLHRRNKNSQSYGTKKDAQRQEYQDMFVHKIMLNGLHRRMLIL